MRGLLLTRCIPAPQPRQECFDLLEGNIRVAPFMMGAAVSRHKHLIAVDEGKFRREPQSPIAKLSLDDAHSCGLTGKY
jgi:hypothetical protein